MGDEADANWDAGLIEAGQEWFENQLKDALFAGRQPKQRQTALRLRGRRFESVEIGDDGKIVEPPQPCRKCGPVLLCVKHAAMVG